MATLREVRNRISGIKKTQKITRAMKMVAAAKLRRAQTAILATRPYARKTAALLQALIGAGNDLADPLIVARDMRATAVVVVTSDRGFCGAFNANLIRAAVNHVTSTYPGWNEDKRVHLLCVGKKGADYFTRRHFLVAAKYPGIFSGLTFASAREVVRTVVDGYQTGAYDRVEVIYNEFKTVAQSRIVVEQLLPIPPGAAESPSGHPAHGTDFIFEPSRETILRELLPRHLNFQLWRVLLESRAAEEGARMAAMENATENAKDLIEALQLQYNKARQASITKELLEVVSGAEALRQG